MRNKVQIRESNLLLRTLHFLLLLLCIAICLCGMALSYYHISKITNQQSTSYHSNNSQLISSNDQLISNNDQLISSNDQTEKKDKNTLQENLFYIGTESYISFMDAFKEAVDLQLPITYNNKILYEPYRKRPEYVKLQIKEIYQYPELPRGCEVTSLAMILNYRGISINKMELAAKIKKDTTPYKKINGKTYYGNPYDGFVGSMYNLSERGYGVYHGPLTTLARNYSPNVVDLTGISFDAMLSILAQSNPILVITNTTYKALEDSLFEYWHTPTGIVKITMKEHSVVLTGYDNEFIYFKDPLTQGTQKALLSEFEESWKQMGNQAITIL